MLELSWLPLLFLFVHLGHTPPSQFKLVPPTFSVGLPVSVSPETPSQTCSKKYLLGVCK